MDNCLSLLLTLLVFPPKKKTEKEKKSEVAKPVLNNFFKIQSVFTYYTVGSLHGTHQNVKMEFYLHIY